MKSAKQIDCSILRVFLVKSIRIFNDSLRASCRVIFNTDAYIKIFGWGILTARSGKNVVSQGFINNISRRNRDFDQPYQWRLGSQRSLATAREDRQLIWMFIDNRFIPTARLRGGGGDDLLVSEEVVSSEHGKQAIWLLAIGIGAPPDVPDLLGIAVDAAMCGKECTEDGTSGTWGTVSSVTSLTPHCLTVMVMLVCSAGKGKDR